MSASTSSTFVIPAIFGSLSQSRPEYDLEAQVIVGTHEQQSLPTPPSALTNAPRSQYSPVDEGTNPIDDFFGVVRPSRTPRGTQDSRHDAMSLPVHHDDAPPPYSSTGEPPAYSRFAEHPTLAMYLFRFGFLFPLFWLAGALILISPLRAPEDWEVSKTEAEREELIESMRRTEMKWAKRCLVAFSLFSLVILVAVLAAVFIMKP
ncbi:predicted protein [Postia placenta Mad-698-R]|uniref:Transmembrane protein n=1 Tax=Postia placenta MAD-698-R-SB12 TaxID=670580 RepID=A0A1X6N4G9_9APHY|nr:hypothetical protein POSPLADRAFT_1055560 [Postia placenta MAD-698-R-SB12]EED84910.1 predicted protein [Postia placenta Mad-698-R]OSX63505.1 hypothetical protein POSPLADRAFT_1055560 [Postia placenta MAD-698-R-SB12]